MDNKYSQQPPMSYYLQWRQQQLWKDVVWSSVNNLSAIDKKIQALENKRKSILDSAPAKIVKDFYQKPVSTYDEKDFLLASINPQAYKVSKEYDKIDNEINILKWEKVNLDKAMKMLYWDSYNQMAWINEAAERQQGALALQKWIQQWSAQWFWWAAWATAWQLARSTAEISNQYAPQSASVEAQRQQALSNVYWQRMSIPTNISSMWATNIQTDLAKAQLDAYNESKWKYKSPYNF